MNDDLATATRPPKHLDYSITGENSTKAIERGLAEADWYQSPVPCGEVRKLLERRDGPAFRTDWLNNFLYEVASLMVMRESVVWRWSRTRVFRDSTGHFVEESDRYAQALLYRRIALESFDAAHI